MSKTDRQNDFARKILRFSHEIGEARFQFSLIMGRAFKYLLILCAMVFIVAGANHREKMPGAAMIETAGVTIQIDLTDWRPAPRVVLGAMTSPERTPKYEKGLLDPVATEAGMAAILLQRRSRKVVNFQVNRKLLKENKIFASKKENGIWL
ncbi:MAG: hypothetical protein K9M57_09005 [Phycisphaerae bacterium]|nr:hypothetical protein [Phycisphaerae bacterium]